MLAAKEYTMKANRYLLLPIALVMGATAGLSAAQYANQTVQDTIALPHLADTAPHDTRMQVQSPVIGAEAAGLIERGEATAPEAQRHEARSFLRRDYVQAEAAEAYRMGLVAQGESYPEPTPAQVQQMQLAAERAVMDTQLARVDEQAVPRY